MMKELLRRISSRKAKKGSGFLKRMASKSGQSSDQSVPRTRAAIVFPYRVAGGPC